jgi:hypothetical protein
MEPQININSSLDIEHIYNAFSNVNYPADNESIQFSNLINNEDQNLNLDNYCLNNNQNLIEEANDNMEENAAPHISNNLDNLNIDNVLEESQVQDFSNFSLLNSLNFCDINKDAKDFDDNNNINFNEQIDLEKKENDCEKKELHFQMGDFVTPSGDNDNIDNSNNNLNSKSTNSGNNKIETPGNNLSNSSSSQNTNKSSVLSISLSNNTPLNNSSNEKLEVICKTFYPGTKTEEEEIKENEKELNPTPKKKTTKKPKTKKKYKLEGIRKKIKSRLHKKLKCYFNKKLTECGSKMLFDCFPQSFITDVSVIKNKAYLNLSMRKLLTMIFGTRAKDKEKINVNKKVLYYLDDNPEIRIKSGVDKFLNSLYRDIINEYMEGKLFEEDLNKLKKEGKSEEYIGKYKYLGEHLVEFFENGRIPKTPDS